MYSNFNVSGNDCGFSLIVDSINKIETVASVLLLPT